MNNQGWICPNCGRGNAPSTPWCCKTENRTSYALSPLPYNGTKVCKHGMDKILRCWQCVNDFVGHVL